MAKNDNQFYTAVTRLEAGDDPTTIADELNISKSTLLRWKREYAEAKEAGTLAELIDIDTMVITKAGELMDLPPEEVQTVVKKMDNHQKLSEELNKTALAVVAQVKSTILSAEHISQLSEAAEILCSIQTAFFAKGTQVNVQNNFGEGNSKYGSFLNDKPTH